MPFKPHPIQLSFRSTTAVWTALSTALILSGIIHLDNIRLGQSVTFSIEDLLVTALQIFVLALILLLYNFAIVRRHNRLHLPDESATRSVVWIITGSLVIAFLYALFTPSTFISSLILDELIALVTILITFLLFNLNRRHDHLLRNERTEAESVQTRYQALQQQIDPHFLFNSLGTLDGLIGIDDNRAHQYLQQLASSYRYIMRQDKEVSLREEMDFCNNFIGMMQLRYGDNLHIAQQIDPGLLNHRVPHISIQLLIENALKHNIVSNQHPLTVTITASDGAITVANPLQPRIDSQSDPQHNGIGLINLSQRYQLLYHQDINIQSTDTTFSVTLPLQQP